MSFTVVTQVSWSNELQHLTLIPMNDLIGTYPVITKRFFVDLVKNIEAEQHYWTERGFNDLVVSGKHYEPHEWILLWAVDFKDRAFWILFSRSPEMGGRGAIAAVGPNEFGGFLQQMGDNAIVPTLTLLNDPTKIKKCVIIVSAPEKAKEKAIQNDVKQFKQWVDSMKSQQNVEGQWFPTFEPVCPNCNERMLGVADVKVGFVQMICPRCGHQKRTKYKS